MTILKKHQTGSILILMCKTEDDTWYVEAENVEFRVWRLTRDRRIADEYFKRFRFWSWLIEAIPSRLFLKVATYFMRL